MAVNEQSSAPSYDSQNSNKDPSLRRPLQEHLVRNFLNAVQLRTTELHDAEPTEAKILLRDALRERATDIHLDSSMNGVLIRFRIDGIVTDGTFLDPATGKQIVNQFKNMARFNPKKCFAPEQGRFTHQIGDDLQVDLRVSRIPCLRGDKLSIRLFELPVRPYQLHELGLYEKGLEYIQDWLSDISGLLLVAGPTGCGKTTTLYSLLHKLKLHERNILTLEDPVEYEVQGINHIQVDDLHGLGFDEGIKAMLRLDPDYMMLGEIRDAPSAKAAIAAAGSGHAVMSTLHSRDALGVIDTLFHFGISGDEISSNLILVVAQRLVRKLCRQCRIEEAPNEEEIQWLTKLNRYIPEKVWHSRGCVHCRNTGYHGLTGVFEVWRVDREDYQLILHEADRRTRYQQLTKRGHQFLLDKGLEKVSEGITSLSELRAMTGFGALPELDTVS
ncbi:MAG: ATPase, T2SS/T4P/T4SS family [Desulfobulbaceae bacterium]|nr:ATPase, T2SS/T4P/T4SS family [Desulfobulbaceae bacterium]